MNFILSIYIGIIGLVFGSFFNVVGIRVPKEEIIGKTRSKCPTCDNTLSSVELIPVFSYLFLRGKCRVCKHKISFIYPLIELSTGCLFFFSAYTFGLSGELLVSLSLISLLMIVFVSDIRYMLIPDKFLLFFVPVFLILRLLFPIGPWWEPLLGGLVGFLLLYLIAILSKGGMGGGDIKLFGVLGLILGVKGVLLAFFFATFVGAVIGMLGLIIGKVKRGEPMPFGPFIVIGTIIAYFFGESIVKWYQGYFLNFF